MQMLDILDEEDRALLILKYAENYSHEELAEIFGISVSACKMRISRARDKIQERFGSNAEEKST
jgi:RNA polymerase sigma-70 factor (ECF subfamily)